VTFAAPTLLWLLVAVPLAAWVAAWAWRRRLAADAAWAGRGLWDRLRPGWRPRRLAVSAALVALAVAGVAGSLARPRWGAVETEVERTGVDVVFVLDSSLSMNARDVVPSRLTVAETLIRRLVREMPGNRVALVQAEGEGVVLAPLTLDGAVIDLLLDAVEPGSLPVPGTELAPAFGAALELFDATGDKHRVAVLLSDGEDHGAGLDETLDRLSAANVAVHVLGVGTPEGAPVPLPGAGGDRGGGGGLFGRRDGMKRDASGDVVISRLDEPLLEGIAAETGGVYLRATGPALDLAPLRRRIDAMEKTSFESDVLTTEEERFQWPLALAAAALLAHLVAGPFAHRRPSRVRRGRTARRRAPAADSAVGPPVPSQARPRREEIAA